jgi:hypothetical protein
MRGARFIGTPFLVRFCTSYLLTYGKSRDSGRYLFLNEEDNLGKHHVPPFEEGRLGLNGIQVHFIRNHYNT